MMSTALIVLVKNGGPRWHRVVASIQEQTLRPQRVAVIDSGSTDGSWQMAVEMVPECEIVIFLTQDAVLEGPDTLEQLVSALRAYPQAGVAYERQLPRAEADPIERHARLFNYPEGAAEKSLKDIQRLGIKTAFSSNSFAAYRRRKLLQAGGFPQNCAMREDMIAAARILLQGGTVIYAAQARVIHSHGFTVAEEARRYYGIGRMHAQQHPLLARFQSPAVVACHEYGRASRSTSRRSANSLLRRMTAPMRLNPEKIAQLRQSAAESFHCETNQ